MQVTGMRYRWRVADHGEQPTASCLNLANQLGVPPIVALLLQRRGLTNADAARSFMQPKLTDLHDPADLPGVARAATRMKQAVDDGQPIVIYGDYDVDGISASAILWHTLKLAGAKLHCYVPHRVKEGYGLNVEAIQQIAQWQFSEQNDTPVLGSDGRRHGDKPLIVSVDCGITAMEPARTAQDAKMDLIITDHHEIPKEGVPNVFAVVHPRLEGSRYPFGYLCGAGVAFKLAWQFARLHCGSERLPEVFRDLMLDLLSLAALGTVADVVPLVDENRVITSFGLGQIKRTRFAGLDALIDAAGLRQEKISAFHVGFVLAPRINASGRMGHARQAVRLLTEADEAESAEIATFLTGENEKRRATERVVFEEAKQMVLDGGYDSTDHRAVVLCRPQWHIGVLGIVASRLVDAFARPIVLLTLNNGQAHGSARSVKGVAVHEAIEHCAPLLNSFGGHAMAAGLRLDADKVDQFRIEFTKHVNDLLEPEDLVNVLDVDAICTLDQMRIEVIDQISRLGPFGRANPSPTFCLRDVQLFGPPQRVGSEGQHLRLPLRQDGHMVYAIGFGLADLADGLYFGTRLDLVFEPKLSTWRGKLQVEYHVKDIRMAHKPKTSVSIDSIVHDP